MTVEDAAAEEKWELRFEIREEVATKGLADKGVTKLGTMLEKLRLDLEVQPTDEARAKHCQQFTPLKRVRSGGINVPTLNASITSISSMLAGQGGGAEEEGSTPQVDGAVMTQRGPLSSGGGASAEPDRAKRIRSERSPERSEKVARIVRAMLLFDQYSKADSNAPAPGHQTSREDRRAPGGNKADKVLGAWEQQQILRHSGLTEMVSERRASKALALARDLSKGAPSSQEGALTDRPRGRMGEKKSIDKRLHYAWMCAIAQELGVRDMVADAVVSKVLPKDKGEEEAQQKSVSVFKAGGTTHDALRVPSVAKFHAAGMMAMLAAEGAVKANEKARKGKTERAALAGKLPRVPQALDPSKARGTEGHAPPGKGAGTRHEDTTYLLPMMLGWKHAPGAEATMLRAGKPRPRQDPPPPEAPWLNDATGRLEPLKVRLQPLKRTQTRHALSLMLPPRPPPEQSEGDDAITDSYSDYYAPPGIGRVKCTVLVFCPVFPSGCKRASGNIRLML